MKPTTKWLYGALIVVLCAWILQSFLLSLLVACVTAIASWPVYQEFGKRLPRRLPSSAAPLIFTAAIALFILTPLSFAFSALFTEVHDLVRTLAAADERGIAVPPWLEDLPFAGTWLATRWQNDLAHPGALGMWVQRIDSGALLSWAQSLGQFMGRQIFMIAFTVLVLFFLYQEGQSLAEQVRRVLRQRFGEFAERSLDVATRALRASTNSVLVVALFNGVATGVVYALTGVPHAAVWATITGALALVPLLGYVAAAIATLTLQAAGASTAVSTVLFMAAACVLFCGDKVLRPAIARNGTGLSFVWVLMACLGGFEVLGLVGLIVGPVVLALTRELWEQQLRNPQRATGRPIHMTAARREECFQGHESPRRYQPSKPGGSFTESSFVIPK